MKKNLKKTLLVLVIALMTLATFNACDMGLPWDIELWGTWIDEYGSKRIVTNETIEYYSLASDAEPAYVFTVAEFDNNTWNSGEIGTGDYGYAVCECTTAPSWNSSQQGTFTVFRWQNLAAEGGTTTVSFAEGAPLTWPDGYGETAAEALTEATTANGWFFFSSATLQDE